MIKPIHPFPARMASDIAIAELKSLQTNSVILDPMAGSGTVVRQASEFGFQSVAFDMDPLAVLMTKVWTTPVKDEVIENLTDELLSIIQDIDPNNVILPWIDNDQETQKFIDFWFGPLQKADLRRLAFVLDNMISHNVSVERQAAIDVLRMALSRIIITKNQGASLARDVSHSRPHKVTEHTNFNVITAFERSVKQVRQLLLKTPPIGNVQVELGDARLLDSVQNDSIDAVLTSPPYLNAIDYMRGHRLSLVWLGYKLRDLRRIRSNSIGAERGPDSNNMEAITSSIMDSMGPIAQLPNKHLQMIRRYAEDVYRFMFQTARVLKPNGRAILVVGDSCLRNVFISNSNGINKAASLVGLKLQKQMEREIPNRNRYLPTPSNSANPLGKRMRIETILTFVSV